MTRGGHSPPLAQLLAQVLHLIENIEELDDVVQVDSNLELSEEALAQLG